MLLKAAMPFNFSSPEYLSHHRTRKNRVSPVSRASPAHMNSPLYEYKDECIEIRIYDTDKNASKISKWNFLPFIALFSC